MSYYVENFETIFGVKDNIQALRNKVLDLAIRGKLVEQDPNEESASVLLKKIQAEKNKLVMEGKITKEKSLKPIEIDEIPFEIPKSWVWTKAGDMCNVINYGYTASARESIADTKLLRITDIQYGRVNWDSVPYCEIEADKVDQYRLNENDIVIARTGGTVGKSFIIRKVDCQAVYASYLIRMIPNKQIDPEYYYTTLNSPLYWSQIMVGARGGAQPNVNAQTLSNLMLPLPPKAEQNRIVHEVESLMSKIDKLEESLSKKVSVKHI